jgi:hypothetical protein
MVMVMVVVPAFFETAERNASEQKNGMIALSRPEKRWV